MSARSLTTALDHLRFDALCEFAELAASYWTSVAQAASREELLTVQVHCSQVAAVTREAFATVKTLGTAPPERAAP